MNSINNEVAQKIMGLDNVVETDYLENLNDAFMVLEKLHTKGWFWRLDSLHEGVECILQRIVGTDPKNRQTFAVRSSTASKAIVECALRTVSNGTTEKTT